MDRPCRLPGKPRPALKARMTGASLMASGRVPSIPLTFTAAVVWWRMAHLCAMRRFLPGETHAGYSLPFVRGRTRGELGAEADAKLATSSVTGDESGEGKTQSTKSDKRNMVLKRSEEHTSELQSLRHLVCRL